jgi:Secretion system C-terminal sorting domain/PAP2 superfamily
MFHLTFFSRDILSCTPGRPTCFLSRIFIVNLFSDPKPMKPIVTLLLALLLISNSRLMAQSAGAETYNADVARDWFGTELHLIKNVAGFSPPVASRALGYTGLSLYESLQGGIENYNSVESFLPAIALFSDPVAGTTYHWPTVANNCLALILDSLFANANTTMQDSIHNLRDRWNTTFQGSIPAQVFDDSKAFGELVATEVFNYSATDGGHQGYLTNTNASYVPPVGAPYWVPTPPAYGMALQPYWGDNRPFVEENINPPCIPPPPPTFLTDTNSAMYGYAWQVYVTVNSLSPGQENIARYWGDGGGSVTPPGHSISILTQVLEDEGSDLAFAARAYAMLAMSQTDAFISCWRTKYTYSLMRPVTYIRNYIDSNWSPLLTTPPFPEYTSGHSTQGGAMTSVMNHLFGTSYSFIDSTHGTNFGGPRSFSCFDEAAYEAATSRLYGGIHYEFSDVFAITLGKEVGQNVVDLFEGAFLSTKPIVAQPSIHLYPNPTADYALIHMEGFSFGKIEIYDGNGQRIGESENNAVIDLTQLPAGTYFLKVLDKAAQLVVTQKVVKI